MKKRGATILLYNGEGSLLLFLRDDKPGLPCANMWDLPGSHVEAGETPDDCIVREMREELGVDIKNSVLFRIYEFDDRTDHVFSAPFSRDAGDLKLTEGQALGWFTESEIEGMELAFGFNRVTNDFFASRLPKKPA